MAIEHLDLDEFLKLLKSKQGDQLAKQFAQDLNVSASYLSDVYNGRREPGSKILKAVSASRRAVYDVVAPDPPSDPSAALQPPPSTSGDPNEE